MITAKLSKTKTAERQKQVLNSYNCGYTFTVLSKRYNVSLRGIKRIFHNAVMNFGEFQSFN